MKNTTISSSAVSTMKAMIGQYGKIVNLEVRGKWLCALLDNGVYFSVLNKM